MKQIPIPTERISPKAITVWRIQDLIFYSFTLLLFSALLFLTHYYHWFDWIRILLLITIGIIILQTVYKLSLHPILLQKTWRYSINMDYVQIRHGIFHTFHTIIPMSRIEFVNTKQGPVLRRFDLTKMTIGTITSTMEIPAIPEDDAKKLREQIVYYAKLNPKIEMDETNE